MSICNTIANPPQKKKTNKTKQNKQTKNILSKANRETSLFPVTSLNTECDKHDYI